MPGRFRSGYKKKFTASKRAYGRGSNVGRVAAQAARRVIMSMGGRGSALAGTRRGVYARTGRLNDLNYRLYQTGAFAVTSAGTMNSLMFPPTSGTGPNSRLGDKVCWKSLDLTVVFSAVGQATGLCGPPILCRVTVAWVKNPGGAGLPAVSGASGLYDIGTISLPFSPYSYDSRDRFQIIADRRVRVGDFDTTLHKPTDGATPTVRDIHIKKSMNMMSVFSAGNAISTDFSTALPFVCVSSDNANAIINCTIQCSWRYEA